MPTIPRRLRPVFLGSHGIRALWRLAIFAVCVVLTTFVADRVKVALIQALPHGPPVTLDPVRVGIGELGDFSTLIVGGLVMARIEKRRIADYGLALSRGFRATFWEGAAYGFAGVSLVVGVAAVAGYLEIGPLALHGAAILRWAALFAFAFLAIALMEEYAFRGYALYTLSTGIGFWPTTVVLAALFGFAHSGNAGETAFGLANVVVFFVVFCFVLRRTGDLWLGVGFHMAWNWAESFFYGLPDSGVVAPQHLFAATIHGPDRWTGGTAGPEATIMDLVVLIAIALIVHLRYPAVRYQPGGGPATART